MNKSKKYRELEFNVIKHLKKQGQKSYKLGNNDYIIEYGNIWLEIQTNLFTKIIPTATTKLKVRAAMGPHLHCC